MAYGFFSSCCPSATPMVVSEATIEIWNGRDQSGYLRIGVADILQKQLDNHHLDQILNLYRVAKIKEMKF